MHSIEYFSIIKNIFIAKVSLHLFDIILLIKKTIITEKTN